MPVSDARSEVPRRRPTVAWRDLSGAHSHLTRLGDFEGAGAFLLQGWTAS